MSQLPNGQSGHFVITKSDLALLVVGMAPPTEIGDSDSGSVTVGDLLETLADERQGGPAWLGTGEIYVSQQDRDSYIIILGDPSDWISVGKKSPLAEVFDHYLHEVWPRICLDRWNTEGM
jgi:hypothetical protein